MRQILYGIAIGWLVLNWPNAVSAQAIKPAKPPGPDTARKDSADFSTDGQDALIQNLTIEHIGATSDGILAFLATLQDDDSHDEEISRFIKDLESDRYQTRKFARDQLKKLGRIAIPQLEEALKSDLAEVRLSARAIIEASQRDYNSILYSCYRRLIHLKASGAVRPIAMSAKLATSDYAWKQAILATRRLARSEDVKFLRKSLTGNDQRRIELAIGGLGKVAEEADWKLLREKLTDKHEPIRLAAAWAFLDHDPREAVPAIIELLNSEDVQIRGRALRILAQVTDERFEFIPYDSPENRGKAVGRWRQWLAKQTDFKVRPFRQTTAPIATSFLISNFSEGVCLVDGNGKQQWHHECDLYDAQMLANGHVLLCERSAGMVRIIDRQGKEIRRIKDLSSPTDGEYLPNGNLLVLENGSGNVSEFDLTGKRIWTAGGLNNPYDVDRLANGHTLIADSGNSRLVEFDSNGKIKWEAEDLGFVNNACRLPDGNTAYTTYTDGGVSIISPDGRKICSTTIPGGTVYAINMDGENLVVGDGANEQIVWLNHALQKVRTLKMPNGFGDVNFVRR